MKSLNIFSTDRFCSAVPVCMLLLALMGGAGRAFAAEEAVQITKIEIGFERTFRVGAWTEGKVEVTVQQPGTCRLKIDAPDADDNVVTYTGPAVELKAGEKQTLTCLFKSGRIEGDLVFHFESQVPGQRWESRLRPDPNFGESRRLQPALTYGKKFWISIGKPAGLGKPATDGKATEGESTWVLRTVDQGANLPEHWLGYQGVDTVILVANAKDQSGKRILDTLSPAQHSALEQWVGAGGQLLIGLGKDSKQFIESPIGKWFPGKLEGEYQLRTFAALQTFTGKPVRYGDAVTSAQLQLDARLTVVPGVNGVLAGEIPFRLGRISFVALDLDHPLFEKWEGVNRFYEHLLSRTVERSQNVTARKSGARLSHSGISDISTQWYQAVSNFEAVKRTSIWGNLALIMIYLVIVGPLDYFVVHRVLKRPEFTWLTLPVWILLGAGCGLVLARNSNGSEIRSNQISIVDVDQGTGAVHGRSWWSVYSPETRRYTLSGTAENIFPQQGGGAGAAVLNGWWSPAENIVGGLYRKSGLQFGRRAYSVTENEAALENVPVQVWSTKGFSSDWTENAKPFVKSTLQSAGTGFGILSGTITWELGEELQDCMLVYGNQIFFPTLGRRNSESHVLPTGIEWTPGLSTQSYQRDLRGYLTKLKIRSVASGATNNSKPVEELQSVTDLYNVRSRNIAEILRTLTFHEFAGGSSYTGLNNDLLSQMDWSAHLRLGRGVLFGRLKKSALKLGISPAATKSAAHDEEYTYVRSLLPVTRQQNVDLREFGSAKKALEETPAKPDSK